MIIYTEKAELKAPAWDSRRGDLGSFCAIPFRCNIYYLKKKNDFTITLIKQSDPNQPKLLCQRSELSRLKSGRFNV